MDSSEGDQLAPLYDNVPVLSPDSQKVVLFNCCNEELSPASDTPGIRIVGFFHDKEEAQRKVRRIELATTK